MTVPATPRRAGPYNGNGATTAFGFSFKAFAETDVRVVVLDVPTSVETDAVLNSDFTVALNPDQESNPGGTVNYLIAPAATKKLTLIGDLNYEQPIDLPDGGAYRAQQVEDGMDRLAIQMQQLKEIIDRCAQVPVSSQDTSTLFDSINTLSANIAALQTIVANIAALLTLAMNIDDVSALVPISGDITTVAGVAPLIPAAASIADDITDVVIVATNIAKVVAVADDIPNLAVKVGRDSPTGSAFIPSGTTAQRSAVPADGYTRHNKDLRALEFFDATSAAWLPAGQGATGAPGNPMFYENDKIMTGDYTLAGTKNAIATGPVEIATGVSLTVSSGATLVIA